MDDTPKKKIKYIRDVLGLKIESPAPPAPGFTSPFATLQEWLFDVCDAYQPEESISEYSFRLYESPQGNMICLVGYNTDEDVNHDLTIRSIAFQPPNTFFELPKNEYGHLSQELMRKRIFNELIEFMNSAKFKNSYLSKGKSITTSFGGKIWSG